MGPALASSSTRPRLVIVFVVDGLRPDAITLEDTPTLFRLRAEGVAFTNGHAVVPTVTRVNAATLVTGMQPGRHGICGNQMYVPTIEPARAFGTDDHRRLLSLQPLGGVLRTRTLADRLHAHGLGLAGVSSGSTGSALLSNPTAPAGVGWLVNGYFEPGRRVAYPDEVSTAILAKLGPPPPKGGAADRYDDVVAWTERVLCEYVLPDLRPTVIVNWLTEPDHTQHHAGVGSPAARAALAADDREIARVLAALEPLGLAGATSVIVVSDHGFTTNSAGVDVGRALLEAGLKAAPDSDDVVVASSGQAVGLHVKARDLRRIARLARFVHAQPWGGVVFTAGLAPGDPRGAAEGTFALDWIHAGHDQRGPDLLVTFPWTSAPNAFGVPGTDLACVSGGAPPLTSDHGSPSPWNIRSTLLAWGAGFKHGVTSPVPAGNVDVVPTILALLGLEDGEALDGRVLAEALDGGPDPEQVVVQTRVDTVTAADYTAAVQVSTTDGRRYVDKGWRVR